MLTFNMVDNVLLFTSWLKNDFEIFGFFINFTGDIYYASFLTVCMLFVYYKYLIIKLMFKVKTKFVVVI